MFGPIVLGYHGCDREMAGRFVSGEVPIRPSRNPHDWLGEGIYVWENNPERALRWAQFMSTHPLFRERVKAPAVVGLVITLGNCLDLTEARSLGLLRAAYAGFTEAMSESGVRLPENKKGHNGDEDLVRRYLDCAVINFLHLMRERQKLLPLDSVRGAFHEGDPLYPGAAIREKTHIQIAVRNPACIVGVFHPKHVG